MQLIALFIDIGQMQALRLPLGRRTQGNHITAPGVVGDELLCRVAHRIGIDAVEQGKHRVILTKPNNESGAERPEILVHEDVRRELDCVPHELR